MKKFKVFLSVVLVALIFTGCGSEKTATYVSEQSGITSTLVFTYKGDKVLSQTAENTIPYSTVNATNKEEAKAIFDQLGTDEYEGVDGVTYSLEYFEDHAVEKTSINYENLDYEKASALPGITLEEGAEKSGVSMKKTEQWLLSSGFEKVE